MALTVHAAARTHVGLVRQRNEDAFHVGQSLLAVADGMGGCVAGDIASATVIDVLRLYDRPTAPVGLSGVLGQAIHAANQALKSRITAEPDLAGMGTTLVAMLWADSTAVVANIGDSRVYLLRGPDSPITPITEDHTYGNLVADADDVPNLPGRIARFLDGRADGRSPDLNSHELHPGDRFLLCSDGLSSVVAEDLIRDTLTSVSDPAESAERLIALAVDHGGPDNITVVVVDVQD
jgi:serine/threonine protein phosphatase PrpC